MSVYTQQANIGVVRQPVWARIAVKIAALTLFIAGLHFLFIYKVALIATGDQIWFIKGYILLTGLFLGSRFFIVIFYRDDHTKTYASSRYPSVSFVIAAKNEAESIFKTIVTCMDSEYPASLECIAVDDGSTDNTRQEMLRAAGWYAGQGKRVEVVGFDKNRGKREAMAEGIMRSTGEIVVFVDSDSFPDPHAVQHIVEHFLEDSRIGAVSGNSGVENKDENMLTKMQSARYGISFDIFKVCESVFGTVTCCPGCFSAYRRDVLLTVVESWRNQTFLGTRSTFGDDRSLTNFVLRTWKVVYCQRAMATTIVPDKYWKFFRQQLRWKKSWVREGASAATFIWKKHPIAALSFYTNLLLPIFSPIVVFYALIIQAFMGGIFPVVFLGGVLAMSFLYGLFYFIQTSNRYWWYVVPFTLMYTLVLVWQMPYAIIRLRDTSWGTR